MSDAIVVEGLSKSFGLFRAVESVSFTVARGTVAGFIGANGAGKTTTMRLMASLDAPDEGTILIAGHDVTHDPRAVRALLGWMPDSYLFYRQMTVIEYLELFCRAYGYRGTEVGRRVRDVVEFTDLGSLRSKMVESLSKGMSQRLCLGRTLLHDPEVLILDEPAAGLDPQARLEFKNLVRVLSQGKKTLLISSHILTELEDMSDSLIFIDKGRTVHVGSAESLKQANDALPRFLIRTAGETAPLEEWIKLNPGVELLEVGTDSVQFSFENADPETVSTLLRRVMDSGIPVIEFRRMERRLEEVFVDALKRSRERPTNKDSERTS